MEDLTSLIALQVVNGIIQILLVKVVHKQFSYSVLITVLLSMHSAAYCKWFNGGGLIFPFCHIVLCCSLRLLLSFRVVHSQWAEINLSTFNQRCFNVDPQLSPTILNVDI